MLRKTSKNLVKNVLSFTKVKLLYTRITLTRYTAVFFWAALINFIIGVVFQGISLQDHLNGDHVVSTIFQTANLNETTMGLPLLVGNTIRVCDGVPGVEGTTCNGMPVTHGSADTTDLLAAALLSHNSSATMGARSTSDCSLLLNKRDSSLDSARPVYDDNGKLVGVTPDGQILLDLPCITSFVWLAEMLRDAKREDIATLTFQIWLLTLAVVTILNESLPHLGTVLIGHVLLTGWAAFRISESFRLKSIYETAIVGGPCRNFDPMGNWWDVRLSHAIPMVVMNGLALIVMGGLSIKLFRVYAKQTFSRVGATAQIHHLYKLVLFLSACLQLTGFFTLVSAAIWLDKIGYGPVRPFVDHFPIYLAGSVITAVFTIPWLVLGWTSVRRERRNGLIAFFGLSFVMLSIAIAMFASPIYRFVFDRWPFFATMTVTSFVVMLATAFIGALCGRNFGNGLAQYCKFLGEI
ncbi:hypothetical protein DL96DRAFT_240512 [Flagelloscypha sp. PMI_526]|nr:hypothetical protein DL96DRAFT_240512 [Flagelloscypha sp. PMI_526]